MTIHEALRAANRIAPHATTRAAIRVLGASTAEEIAPLVAKARRATESAAKRYRDIREAPASKAQALAAWRARYATLRALQGHYDDALETVEGMLRDAPPPPPPESKSESLAGRWLAHLRAAHALQRGRP